MKLRRVDDIVSENWVRRGAVVRLEETASAPRLGAGRRRAAGGPSWSRLHLLQARFLGASCC